MENKTLIHITSKSFCKSTALVSQLKALGMTPILWDQQEPLEFFLRNAEWLIVGTEKIDQFLIGKMPQLKGISKYGVGTDNLDLDFLESSPIQLALNPGTNRVAVAEYALSFLLTGMHLMHTTSMKLKQKIWHKDGGQNLSLKTVGIIGFGHVGQELARLLAPFNCQLLVNELDESKYVGNVSFVDLKTVLKESHAVSLHIPFTSQTKHLINKQALDQMRTNSILVNTSRGGIVDHDAMLSHLKLNPHFQYLADTHSPEPYDGKMVELENFMGTPHSAGNSIEAIQAMGEAAIDGMRKLLEKGKISPSL
jgi:phosphoglycerate dehydrogenase-like enzyme